MAEPLELEETSRRDRILRKIGFWAVKGLYRSVDVYHAEGSMSDGPQLAIANHFGGFSDPILLLYAMERRPRFLAQDGIWKVPVVKQLMNYLEAIPVHKSRAEGRHRNDEMFASCYEALLAGEQLTIFPEGTTTDDPSILKLKTGAARIALGARAQGAQGIALLPIGLHYEDKAAFRSRALVNFGPVLDLDSNIDRYVASGAAEDSSNRQAVLKLTEDLSEQLRNVAPDFSDWREAHQLTTAAEVAIRSSGESPGGEVPYGERSRLASLLGSRPPERKAQVVEAAAAYRSDLDSLGLTDQQVAQQMTAGGFAWYLIRSLLLGLVLLPLALAGVALYWFPALLVWVIGKRNASAALLATMKPLAAIAGFLLVVGLAAWNAAGEFGLTGVLVVVLLAPVYLAALILLSERVVLLWRAWRSWRRPRRQGDIMEQLMADREQLIEAVREAL